MNVFTGISLCVRIMRGVSVRFSGPTLLAVIPIAVMIGVGYLAVWIAFVLPINVVRLLSGRH